MCMNSSDINYIDRVDYDGSGNMKISAQKIHREWVNFIAYDDLNQGKFINHCKDDMFRAVKLEGVARRGCAHFFGNIGKTDIVSDNGVFKLYPRINGADAFDPSPLCCTIPRIFHLPAIALRRIKRETMI